MLRTADRLRERLIRLPRRSKRVLQVIVDVLLLWCRSEERRVGKEC